MIGLTVAPTINSIGASNAIFKVDEMKLFKNTFVIFLCIVTLFCHSSCDIDTNTEQSLIYVDNVGYRKLEESSRYVLTDISNYNSTKLVVPDKLHDGISVVGIDVQDFSQIEELHIGDNVSFVYISNDRLKRIHYGANMNESGDIASVNAEFLETITVSDNNTRYYAQNNCVIERKTKAVVYGCKNSVIPDGVCEIGKMAFSQVPLTSIKIPESVHKIGISAFAHCKDLQSIYLPQTVTVIESSAFFGTPQLVINCEAESKPTGWDEQWCYSERAVQRGCSTINWGVKYDENYA